MTAIGIKIAVIIVLTHGLRAVGVAVGPRWGGLVLGLPASTAIVLFFYGHDRGLGFAVSSAESALLGLISAVCFAVVFARLLRRGWAFPAAFLAAVAGFGLTAVVASSLSPSGTAPRSVLVLAFLAAVQAWLSRGGGPAVGARPRRPLSWGRVMVIRTVVPVACLLTVLGIGSRLDPHWAGLIGTFPCTLVAVLIVTGIESGRAATVQTAEAFPLGNVSMVAFIGVFRWCSPEVGLAGGMGCGYLAAFAALALVQAVRSRQLVLPRVTRGAERPAVLPRPAVPTLTRVGC